MKIQELLSPRRTKPEENRRSRLVAILLLSSAIFALACLFVYVGLTLFTRQASLEKNLFTVFICTGTLLIAVPIIGLVNHFFTPRLSGTLYLLILFFVVTVFNLSEDYISGYGLFWFSIPIVFASFMLFSYCSFAAAGLSSLIVVLVSLGHGKPPNILAIAGFFIIALISFLSVKSMENIVRKLEAITEKLQQELAEQKKSQQLAQNENKAKNVFISNITHEIGTPMSAILGISKYLTDHNAQNLNSDQKEGLVMIYQSCKKLLVIINEVMELSRIESGEINISFSLFSLGDLVAELKDSINSLIENKELIIYFQVDSSLPEKIFTDRKKVYQVLFTSLSNLIKLITEKGEIVSHIYKAEQKIFFELKAIGLNLNFEQLHYLVMEYDYGKRHDMEAYSAIGMGFSLCKKIIQLLEGQLAVKDSPGRETLIQFYIPFIFKEEG